MARKTLPLVLFFSCVLSTYSAEASPFGRLYSWQETPDFAPRGLTTSPDIAKWLATLPQSENSPGATHSQSAEVFDARPVGGEGYPLAPAEWSSARNQEATIARQVFDAEPIGSQPYRFTNPLARSISVAEDTQARGGTLEGRSASSGTPGPTPHQRQLETCTCANK